MIVLYDNYRFDPRLKTAWGFSCLVRGMDRTILFDTGGDGRLLLGNMKRLGVEPDEVAVVFLSHDHGDHTGGLGLFLGGNSDITVYLPASFPGGLKRAILAMGSVVEEVGEGREIFPSVYTTGEVRDGIREQALALKTAEGLVVITGCAHPGIVRMVRKAREITGENRVSLVMGGFHLGGVSPARIVSVARELRLLGVERVAPCHCSGDETRRLFADLFGAGFVEAGVGKRIELPSQHNRNRREYRILNKEPQNG